MKKVTDGKTEINDQTSRYIIYPQLGRINVVSGINFAAGNYNRAFMSARQIYSYLILLR